MKRTALSFMPCPNALERLYGANVRFAAKLASLVGTGAGQHLRSVERSLKGLFSDGECCDPRRVPLDGMTDASRFFAGSYGAVRLTVDERQRDRYRGCHQPDPLPKRGACMPMAGEASGVAPSAGVQVPGLLDGLAPGSATDLSPVRSRQREKAIALIRDEALLDAAAYSINNVQLDRLPGESVLCVGGETLPLPAKLPKSGELTALGCGACTLGPGLEARVRQLFGEKRAALALALDYLGNELLQILSRRMLDRILDSVHQQGLSLGQELHVGDPELDISTQAAALRLSGANGIGISLHRSNLLLPTKSTSLVFAIGRELPRVSWTLCEDCPTRKRCSLLH